MQPAGSDATLATDLRAAPTKPTESAALTALVAYIDAKMARTFPTLFVPPEFADDPELALQRKLRSVLQPSSFPDEDAPGGYLWPSSHLTERDMVRLRVWGRLTDLPCNRLLHLSVIVLSEWLRLHVAQVLAKHEQSGIPFEELLGGSPPRARRKRGRSTSGLADQRAGGPPSALLVSVPIVHPPDLSESDSPTPTSPLPVLNDIDAPSPEHTACAAEPPPSSRSRRRSARNTPKPPPDVSDDGHGQSEELLEQLRQTCDEIRVLWQAVDELRESLEHALRNQAPPDEPPRTPSDFNVESTLDELLERLQHLPPAMLADLQQELARMEQPPQQPPPAIEPPPRQPVRPPIPDSPADPGGNGRPGKTPDAPASRYRLQQRLF